mgnify:CR=1 FL=1
MFRHQIIHYPENKILHFRIGQVQHHLRFPTSGGQRTAFRPHNPVRMIFKQFALGVRHFRFNPDTELDSMFLCRSQQPSMPLGNFFLHTVQSPKLLFPPSRGYLSPNHPSSITKSSPPIAEKAPSFHPFLSGSP